LLCATHGCGARDWLDREIVAVRETAATPKSARRRVFMRSD
jgi:hypothetical protein